MRKWLLTWVVSMYVCTDKRFFHKWCNNILHAINKKKGCVWNDVKTFLLQRIQFWNFTRSMRILIYWWMMMTVNENAIHDFFHIFSFREYWSDTRGLYVCYVRSFNRKETSKKGNIMCVIHNRRKVCIHWYSDILNNNLGIIISQSYCDLLEDFRMSRCRIFLNKKQKFFSCCMSLIFLCNLIKTVRQIMKITFMRMSINNTERWMIM